jgi:ABC-type antimicrobial peptide transport system permease subunit
MAVYGVETMREHLNKSLLLPRVCGSLFGIFGGAGLLLATVGLFGLMSYSVRRRTREIGIRMAIGAQPGDILAMVTRQGLGLVATGIAIGIALALAVSRVTAGFLYGIGPRDAVTFVGVPAVLLAVALVAVLIPARRAARVDALTSIRYE